MSINPTLKHLRCFVAVAREGSFTQAAKRVFLTQSALTATIQQLERAVQLKLLDRTTRRVSLTREGASFLPVAERLLQEFDSAIADVRAIAEHRRGQVGIAAAPSVVVTILAPVVARFCAEYPDIRVDIADGGSEFVQRRVLASESDFGVTSRWSDDPGLEFRPLLRDRFGVVCRRDHPFASQRMRATWKRIEGERYIGFTANTGIRATLETTPGVPDIVRRPHHQASSTTTLHAMLEAGLGISVLPALAAHLPPLDRLAFRELTHPAVEREICLIVRRGRALSPAAQTMIAMIEEGLRRRDYPAGVRLLHHTPAR